jgi:hypothetical protein
MPSVSMVCGADGATSASVAASTKASRLGPSTITAMPGLVQNWPAPMVSEPAQPLAISAPARLGASGSRNIGLTEPSSPKNGIGSGRCRAEVEQRASARQRTGEADGLDQRVLDQRWPTSRLPPWISEKTPGCMLAGLDRGVDGLSDDLAGAGMGGMALDHDRAAGGERRGGVAAGGGEGQREVRGAKDGHRADRALHHAQVGARQGARSGSASSWRRSR